MSRPAAALALAVLFVVPGCSFLQPQPDPSRFFVLTPSADTPGELSSSSGLILGLGPIRLPDYLDRAPIVTRVGPNQVVFADYERWAEPLERNFGRVLGEDLSRLVGTERVVSIPAFVPVTVHYEIPIEVLRFESDADGVVELAARWGIRTPSDRKLLHTSESRIVERASGTETQAVVAAMSRAVDRFAEEIAAEINRLGPPAP